jgi:monoamine oxidase
MHQAGIDVVVLEARDRVGGRTWSATLADGTVVERGGEFIAPGDTFLRALCHELGLDVIPHGFSFERRCAPGEVVPTAHDIASLFDEAHDRVMVLADDTSADEVLPAPARRTPIENSIIRRLETSMTVPLSLVSARATFGSTGDEGYDPADRVRGGNDKIARELARRLGERVRLGTPVVRVGHREDGVTVGLGTGGAVEGAAVVLALPLPLLLALDVRPRLPDPVLAAAGRMRFGDAAKLHVSLEGPLPPGGVASPQGLWWCWVSAAPDGQSGAPVLSAFAGGAATTGGWGPETTGEKWARAALALRREARRNSEPPLVTHWAAEEWTGGSYSAPAVGFADGDVEAWGRMWGPIAFAGEHTAGASCGTMNGAAQSGERAARAVIRKLQPRA